MSKLFIIVLVGGISLMAYAQAPTFENGVFINDRTSIIDVGQYSAPHVYDWDADGKKDLLVGQLDLGKIRFYRNVGTNNSPTFNGFSYLTADAIDISLPVG